MPERGYQKRGYVYVLSNQSMPGVLKIGRSIAGGKNRAKQIYTTGVPVPFDVEFEALVDDPAYVESFAHDRLSRFRVNGGREFFRCEIDEAVVCIMDCIARQMDHCVEHLDYVPDDAEMSRLIMKLNEMGIDSHPVPLFRAIMSEMTPELAADLLRKQDERIARVKAAGGWKKYQEMMNAESTQH